MLAIFDSDGWRYQHGSISNPHPFLPDVRIPADFSEITKLIEKLIDEMMELTGADDYICPLGGQGNFRYEVAKQAPYKGNRNPNVSRPYHYDNLTDYILKSHPSVLVNGMEADDWIGIKLREDPLNTICLSRDKDMKTVPGYHGRWSCGETQPAHPPYWISEFEATKFFYYQMLIGDNTDNIMGCGRREVVKWGGKEQERRKGVGKVGATKLLTGLPTIADIHEVVANQYETFFHDEFEDVMLENARLLYIGQTPDNLFKWDWINYKLNEEVNNENILSSNRRDESISEDLSKPF